MGCNASKSGKNVVPPQAQSPAPAQSDYKSEATGVAETVISNPEISDNEEDRDQIEAAMTAMMAKLEDVLKQSRERIDFGDFMTAEQRLMVFLHEVESSEDPMVVRHKAVVKLRHSPEYKDTLKALTVLEKLAEEILGPGSDQDGPWKAGTVIPVDYPTIGFPLDKDASPIILPDHDKIKIFYRLHGKRLDIKVDLLLPTKTPTVMPAVAGLLAMWLEMEAWHTWHPVLMGPSPVECWPRRSYHNLVHIPQKLFRKHMSELVEHQMYLLEESGIFMQSMDGKPGNDPLWKQYPAPGSCKPIPGSVKTGLFCLCQKDVSVVSILSEATLEYALPEFVIKFVISWLLPEIVKGQIKAGASCFLAGGPHAQAMEKDAMGVYDHIRRVARRGADLDAITGRGPYTPENMPKPDVVKNRGNNLLKFHHDASKGTLAGPLADVLKYHHEHHAHSSEGGAASAAEDARPLDLDDEQLAACGTGEDPSELVIDSEGHLFAGLPAEKKFQPAVELEDRAACCGSGFSCI